ncbi:hypothetical protein RFI_20543, partial [Reticulomyxa filosa]
KKKRKMKEKKKRNKYEKKRKKSMEKGKKINERKKKRRIRNYILILIIFHGLCILYELIGDDWIICQARLTINDFIDLNTLIIFIFLSEQFELICCLLFLQELEYSKSTDGVSGGLTIDIKISK